MASYESQTQRGPANVSTASEKSKASTVDFLQSVVKRFARCESAESANRQMALDDLKFKAGDQWPEQIKAQRTIEKRPCLTINKTRTFVHQITNDQRQNRPAIKVRPVGDKSDPETAKMIGGLIKHIEKESNADVAYDTGFDSAVSNGWGYWRIITEYEDETSFNQRICIKRIRNPFTVYLDPDHQEPDGSDAKWGFITRLILRAEYDMLYGEVPPDPPSMWTEGSMGDEFEMWSTETHVRIAEYFYIETKERTLVALDNGHVGWEDELDSSLEAAPRKQTRTVETERVKWCKLTSKAILEENEWVGKWIPIVKVIGDEIDIEGKVTLAGLIRDSKDAQRMYNFWVTSETELIALAPKAPWIMEEGQIEGHENRWKEANNKSLPYLLYKGVNLSGKPAPPPQRQQFAGPPAGVVQAKISAAQDMQATTGIRFDATMQERTYDESGKALRELKRVGDIGNYHYVDNLARSLRFTGEILIDLIPKIYDTPRILTILREDDTEERVKIDPALGQSNGKETLPDGRVQRLFNPKLGNYAVAVTIGPSFATKRQEAAESMISFVKVMPQAAQVAGDLIAKNMDWPGAEEIATRLQSMLPPGVLDTNLDQLPPEAKGMVMSLQQQLQQLKQERDQAVAMLGDKDKDRQIDQTKIDKDFEAKVMAAMTNLQIAQVKQGDQTDPLMEMQLKFETMMKEIELQAQKQVADHILALQQQQHDQQMAQNQQQHEQGLAENQQSMDAENQAATMAQQEKIGEHKMKMAEKAAAAKPKAKA